VKKKTERKQPEERKNLGLSSSYKHDRVPTRGGGEECAAVKRWRGVGINNNIKDKPHTKEGHKSGMEVKRERGGGRNAPGLGDRGVTFVTQSRGEGKQTAVSKAWIGGDGGSDNPAPKRGTQWEKKPVEPSRKSRNVKRDPVGRKKKRGHQAPKNILELQG